MFQNGDLLQNATTGNMTSISSPFVKDALLCSASLSLARTSVEDESIDTRDRKLDLVQVRANTSNDTIDNVSCHCT